MKYQQLAAATIKNNELNLAKLTHVGNTVLDLCTIVRNFAVVDSYHCVDADFANIIFAYFAVQHHAKTVVCLNLNGWSSSCTYGMIFFYCRIWC